LLIFGEIIAKARVDSDCDGVKNQQRSHFHQSEKLNPLLRVFAATGIQFIQQLFKSIGQRAQKVEKRNRIRSKSETDCKTIKKERGEKS
jgi:hypothetical protein